MILLGNRNLLQRHAGFLRRFPQHLFKIVDFHEPRTAAGDQIAAVLKQLHRLIIDPFISGIRLMDRFPGLGERRRIQHDDIVLPNFTLIQIFKKNM